MGIPRDGRPAIVTVGTFDGVHRGHWAVLQEIRQRAEDRQGRSVLVTFHPHPLRIVRPEHAPLLLTTPREKREILAQSGLDYVVFVPFTNALKALSPEAFVDQVLLERVGMDELVIGYDHGFGKGREGDVDLLRRLGAARGFNVDVVGPVLTGPAPVSSSKIRTWLEAGELQLANEGLHRPYALEGVVEKGEGRGRKLGFPTANLTLLGDHKLVPRPGIYAVTCDLPTGQFMGALHIGPRPTFPGSPPTVEVFVLDFDGDLYGETVRLQFHEYLRPVESYDSVDALVAQMHADVAKVRDRLASTAGTR